MFTDKTRGVYLGPGHNTKPRLSGLENVGHNLRKSITEWGKKATTSLTKQSHWRGDIVSLEGAKQSQK